MLYLDSSGLVKLLVVEELLEWGWQSLENTAVATARITWVEVRAAIARREREVPQAEEVWAQARTALSALWPHIRVIELTQAVAARAGEYAETLALRGYDAVQLASALETATAVPGDWAFLSFDRRLNRAAGLLGLGLPDGVPR